MVEVTKAKRIPPRDRSFDVLNDEHDVVQQLDSSILPTRNESESHNDEETVPAAASSMDFTKRTIQDKDRGEQMLTAIPLKKSFDQLQSDNQALRCQISELQAQVSLLCQYLDHQESSSQAYYHRNDDNEPKQQRQMSKTDLSFSSSSPIQQKAGVVLELPRTLRYVNKRPNKDHQSLATEDDQSTVEPTRDWEVHESLSGLKHRHHPPIDATKMMDKRKAAPGSPDNTTRRTDPLSHDGSFYSEESEREETPDKDLDEEEGFANSESRDLICRSGHTEARGAIDRSSPPRRGGLEEEPFWTSVSDRAGWLVGLLVMQSMSSFILARNEALLQQHLVIVRFLTMLVGAGGNAGNQASVRVIRGLAVGSIDSSNTTRFLKREFFMGSALSLILGVAGCIRAAIFLTPLLETVAITTSLYMIVSISIILGALMPLGMKKIGIDPAHSSTTIQVVMDILGVSITVWMSSLVLDSGFHAWLINAFTDGAENNP